MFGWFKRNKPPMPHAAINTLIDAAWNSNAMTWENLYGILNHEKMDHTQTTAALRLSAVKCALDIYTGMIGAVPRRMYGLEQGTQKKNRIISTIEHPASRLFSHYFNPELSADDALLLITYDMLMDGNCYFLREYDAQNRTSRLYYIHPSRIPRGNIFRATGQESLTSGRKAATGELLYRIDTGYSVRDVNVEPLLISRNDIVHFKGKVIDAEYHRGQGFIANSQKSLDLYRASEEFGWRFYSRGIATQMFLTTDNRLAPEVLKRLEANFAEDPNAPLEDVFRTRILEQGLKPVHMGIPFQHLQFIETRAFSVEDVARGLNIPPILLHSYMGTQASGTDLSQAIALFIQTGIGPFINRLTNLFRTELLPLPSQMLYSFEFETLYLYRNVIDRFSTALRNLFEIGILDRTEIRSLLGTFIDPSDPAANPRYVPVNLMTVEHSLYLEEQARLNNETASSQLEMLDLQKENQRKTNEGMTLPQEQSNNSEDAEDPEEPDIEDDDQPDMDKSPSDENIDKRLRTADNAVRQGFINVVNGLKQYEARVIGQKQKSRPDDFDTARNEFYSAEGKFAQMLNEQLMPWQGLFAAVNQTDPVDHLIATWLQNQTLPENYHEVSCTQP